MFVYCLTNTVNQKRYIGVTTQRLRRRITGHFLDAKRPTQQSRLIVRAINKYGPDAFTWTLVGTATSLEELYAMEAQAIQDYNTFYRDGHGYNMTRGGEGAEGYTHTPEVRAQVSARFKGKSLPAEHRAKIGANQRGARNHRFGTTISPEQRTKMLSGIRAKYADKAAAREERQQWCACGEHPRLGRGHCPTIRALLAEKTRLHQAQHGNPRSLPVTYEGVTYPSIKAAMEATGRDRGVFRRLLRQTPRKPPAGGWNKGLAHSEETRAKMRATHARQGTKHARAVTYNGVTYPSIKAAIQATGHSREFFWQHGTFREETPDE